MNSVGIQIVKLHLQILKEGHGERMKGKGEPLLMETNKRTHVTKRQGGDLFGARDQPFAVIN